MGDVTATTGRQERVNADPGGRQSGVTTHVRPRRGAHDPARPAGGTGGCEVRGVSRGRPGLHRADGSLLRRVRAHPARDGEAVIANVVGGVLALALLVYLVVALLRPEKF
ncbi:K(+)-transporting ATPase subunit F [Pseudonocardia spirodelae]|uniref:K(+)-transporting ATPase subunit F n=1 Tax=Pseudonocardia spirodelae TaxID=3133431 RepID=UPI003BF5189B